MNILILTLSLFVLAIISDIRAFRIPNFLCLCFLTIGFAYNTYLGGLDGLLMAIFGAGLMFILLFPVFVFRLLGAGDVKLMMAAGALLGPNLSFWSLVWGITVGGGLTIIIASFRVGWPGVKKTLHRYFISFCLRQYIKPENSELGAIKIPYAPALAIGFLITCYQEPLLRQSFITLLNQAGI